MRSPAPAKRSPTILAALVAAAVCLMAGSPIAHAETTHVVGPGHTLAKIARRYRTTIEALREANGLVPGQKLKPGQRIVIPDDDSVPAPARQRSANASPTRASDEEIDSRSEERSPAHSSRATPSDDRPRRAPKPGTVILSRPNGGDRWTGKTLGRGARLRPGVAEAFRRMLRFDANHARDIDPRLIAVLTQVSDHFGGRPIEIVSGFRPHSDGQHTAHSNHNVGKAIDFVIKGVPNHELRDYCHTLRDVGCGYYPNSSFIHLDVRSGSARWVDESGPGETPRYSSINGAAPPRPKQPSAAPAATQEHPESAEDRAE